MTPLALYLHVPFCVQKCPYCDFYSQPGRSIPPTAFVTALLAEMDRWRRELPEDTRPLQSIFFGGGTPSLLPPEALGRLLEGIRARWSLTRECEITLEANPESVTAAGLEACRAMGFNRLSLGVQAMDPERLKRLQRPHSVSQAQDAIMAARGAGFDNLNLDLIHGTPGHTWPEWRKELEATLAWRPEHLSCYALTLEEGTPLHERWQRGHWELPDEETQLTLLQETRAYLRTTGWNPYETSNFARPGQECRHNLNYWRYGDFIGLGPSAHGKWTTSDGVVLRYAHPPDLEAWSRALAQPDWIQRERLSPKEAGVEFLLMGLRLEEGVDLERYQRLSGEDLTRSRATMLAELLQAGLVERRGGHLALTPRGWPLINRILEGLT